MYRFEGKTREKSKVISGETSLNLLAEERVCGLHIRELKGALTYFLGCVAKEYVCGITWKFFATHRSFYNTALVINIEIEQ